MGWDVACLQFQLAGFARDHFQRHRKGFFIFKRKVPLADMIVFSQVRSRCPFTGCASGSPYWFCFVSFVHMRVNVSVLSVTDNMGSSFARGIW